MKRRVAISMLCIAVCAGWAFTGADAGGKEKAPNVSGIFYPADAGELRQMILDFIAGARVAPLAGRIAGMVSPHAGYLYSGPVAAYGYRSVQAASYTTVVILAPSHYISIPTAAIYRGGAFRTPLGSIAVDEEFVTQLLQREPALVPRVDVFEREHSLEVQLPFLQVVLPEAKIVPILLNTASAAHCQSLANALATVAGEREDVLFVASTDLSHYHAQPVASQRDHATISLIQEYDGARLLAAATSRDAELCGAAAVTTLLMIMQQRNIAQSRLLRYATSYDTTGTDPQRVVGYASVVFMDRRQDRSKPKGDEGMLTLAQQEILLQTARQAMETFVQTRRRIEVVTDDPVLREKRGAFVTLKKNGNLRGCIGRVVADEPLLEVVRDMAIEASTADPRFTPVTAAELGDLALEISVMTPLQEIEAGDEIVIGSHGLLIRKGFHSGLLLPQVAAEYGWSREEFLRHTCRKAGLPDDAWRHDAQIFRFGCEVFVESR